MLLLLLAGCWRDCPPVDPTSLAGLPMLLSETGLFSDAALSVPADGVIAYEPRFKLWADGAEKSRWIQIPSGELIDDSNPDAWVFPVGTRAWKEFRLDGKRLETRMIEKVGAEDFVAVAYQWDEDGHDATQLPEGAQNVADGPHDIPSAEDCLGCHGGRSNFLLGFSAVQLEGATPFSLQMLVEAGSLTEPPPAISQPSAADTEALGYLHANCSHCHNEHRSEHGPSCYSPDSSIDFSLPATALSEVNDAPALQTADEKLNPGHPDQSEVIQRISRRAKAPWPETMPALGSEDVDVAAVLMLRDWIAGL